MPNEVDDWCKNEVNDDDDDTDDDNDNLVQYWCQMKMIGAKKSR